MSGAVSYHGGLAAEDSVARVYAETGHTIEVRRWRSPAGEIDLIAKKGGTFVFVEVKQARDFTAAVERIGARQLSRIARSAEAFLGAQPRGTNSEARIDVALVDAKGFVEIIENVYTA